MSGSDKVLLSLAMNYNGNPNVQGETDNNFTISVNSDSSLNSPLSLDVGEPLLLRWFPQFQLINGSIVRNPNTAIGGVGPNTLQVGDFYGAFRSSVGEGGGISWVAPTGGNYTLIFNTISAGGTHPDSDGFAMFAVSPVPEPSTYALFGFGLGGLSLAITQQRRRQAALRV